MIQKIVFFAFLVAVTCAYSTFNETRRLQPAQSCNKDKCKLPSCRCISTDIPGGLNANKIPQLVLLTFDDAITAVNFEYYKDAFFTRKNPDGCGVGTTYFVSHEYTDYTKLHELHAHGQEIALHSISHETMTTYWDNLPLDGYVDEFGNERIIASKFGKIPEEDIKGLRVPFLQLPGDTSFEAIKEIGLKYDASWPTQKYQNPPIFPYTLDYASDQDCPIGSCPTSALPGVWVQPMVDWTGIDGVVCSMVDSCKAPDTLDGLVQFMKDNFLRHYNSNKAPFGFYVHAAWFVANPMHFEAYKTFLDYLGGLKDVYIVGIQRAIEWTQNPTTTENLKNLWPSCPTTYEPTCIPSACQVYKGDELRYMTQCGDCPDVYPWLGNPLGNA